MTDPRRSIPPVDRLLEEPALVELQTRYSRDRVLRHLRAELELVRSGSRSGRGEGGFDTPDRYARAIEAALEAEELPSLRPVLNATGVVLHTNLGRAPLADTARRAMATAAVGYTNLEYDLDAGVRGSRYVHCADLLRELTGAGGALVVNNNAAALLLVLNTFARDRAVLVSRGELVEIGGGFRVPEILERSGARLREVGSTNRTRLEDYERAADAEIGAILKVHHSNFRITGFAEAVAVDALAPLAHELGVPLLHDLGSGLLVDPERLGLPREPTPRESLSAGVGVVAFSGDKLLGGPQAGVLLGDEGLVTHMKRNPLCRALRVDKVTLAGLEATLRLYRDEDEALAQIPTLSMLTTPAEELELRAHALAGRLGRAGVDADAAPGAAVVGGGTYPGVEIASWTVRVEPGTRSAASLAARLRSCSPPVIGRVEEERVVLDLRTVSASDDDRLGALVEEALARHGR